MADNNVHFIRWSFSATLSGVPAASIFLRRMSISPGAASWISAWAKLWNMKRYEKSCSAELDILTVERFLASLRVFGQW